MEKRQSRLQKFTKQRGGCIMYKAKQEYLSQEADGWFERNRNMIQDKEAYWVKVYGDFISRQNFVGGGQR